ncbi:PREDICTED: surfeit locus protein 6-like [Ceratotherium simum simum]|uniref:Surfeit locus protein 6-like n=1 Tax=Ceratotherium simum simum TaxID=73337 RepID=A0ABM1CD36_CERSS|nr:PREDICTED: surfeit locus protein 6-like [Ceratotherium simum simum]
MASLLTKDAYLQSLARKICSQPSAELQKCESVVSLGSDGFSCICPLGRKLGQGLEELAELEAQKLLGPRKRRGITRRRNPAREEKAAEPKAQALGEKSPATSGARMPVTAKEEEPSSSTGALADGLATEPDSVFALDVLRQRLHEKIREARGQGSTKELSPATLERRRRRKQERDRRKRKRKELRAQEKAAKAEEAAGAADPPPEAPREEAQGQPGLLFNKVEVSEEEPASKAQRRKEKRQELKGNLTPLTGKNYRQLLERLRARQDRLEELRGQDEGKARELEAKMRWTNLLYKAEGVKIRDDEHRLQEALRRKEKRRAQRQRRWEKRTAHVVEKMRRRQDRRRQNLRKKKVARAERRLEKARRKGRILPQDLERAGLV